MRRRNETPAEMLFKLPWWCSAILGILVFAGVRWGLPLWAGSDTTQKMIARGLVPLAPLALIFFGIFAAGSFWFGKKRERLVDGQTSLQSVRDISWKDFEFLVAEAYRRQGFQVDYSLGRGADGGVDLILRRADRVSLVQCKQWKVLSVGASVIREMFGLMTAESADEAIIVTSGNFTREAEKFAEGKPIQLINGQQLLELVQSVQLRPAGSPSNAEAKLNPDPDCPKCGNVMVLRTAKRGSNVGEKFWGCPRYPVCKGTRPI